MEKTNIDENFIDDKRIVLEKSKSSITIARLETKEIRSQLIRKSKLLN